MKGKGIYLEGDSEEESQPLSVAAAPMGASEVVLAGRESGSPPPQYEEEPQPQAHSYSPTHGMEEDRILQPEVWQYDLFSCFKSAESCLLGTFCSCISFGRSSMMLRTRDSKPIPEPRALSTMCNPITPMFYLGNVITSGVAGPIVAMWRRNHIRKRYGIEGSIVGDVCTHFCCHCCALVQEDQEILLREVERRKLFQYEQENLADDYGV